MFTTQMSTGVTHLSEGRWFCGESFVPAGTSDGVQVHVLDVRVDLVRELVRVLVHWHPVHRGRWEVAATPHPLSSEQVAGCVSHHGRRRHLVVAEEVNG